MSSANVNAYLSRGNSATPWGFRMQGGQDFRSPLTVQRVTPGTIAANSGLQPGDLIVQINGVHTGMMKHKDAQQAIISSGNQITLALQSYTSPSGRFSTNTSTSRFSTGIGGSGAGNLSRSLLSSSSYSPSSSKYSGGSDMITKSYSNRYNSAYEPTKRYSSSDYSSSRSLGLSDYTPTTRVSRDYSSSNYTPRSLDTDYSSKYTSKYKSTSDLDSSYSKPSRTTTTDDYKPKTRVSQDDYKPKTRVSQDDYKPKTRVSQDDYKPRKKVVSEEDDFESTESRRLRRRREEREAEKRDAEADVSNTEEVTITTNSSGQSSAPNYNSDVTTITQQTQSLNVSSHRPATERHYRDASPINQSARYQESPPSGAPQYRPYTNPEVQSHSFKVLQNVIESGRDPASYSPKSPWQSQPVNNVVSEPVKYKPSQTWNAVHSGDTTGYNSTSASRPYQPPKQNPYQFPSLNSNYQTPSPKPAGGSKPFVPSSGGQMKSEVPCGDQTATRSKSSYNQASVDPQKIPICSHCTTAIRGPFVLALNKSWCPNHFTCAKCDSELVNMGFVELNGKIYCENDYEHFFAPKCAKCAQAIVGDTVNALDKTWHPKCFVCAECNGSISSGAFHVEDGKPYCMNDWQKLFQTKCTGCSFPVEPGDRWIEALNGNWHSECFVCNVCNTPLEGKPFYPRDGKPFCKGHAGAA